MNWKKLRPENQLLLCCAQIESGDPHEQRSARAHELAAAPLDWELLSRLAQQHNLSPLLYWNLKSWSAPIPPAAEQRLRFEFERSAARSLFLTSQLLEILALFKQHGIEALAYKGPALAMAAYSNLLLRSFCDLDLLLHAEDIPRAGELLLQAGYAQAIHAGDARNDYAQQWERSEGAVVVELHWNILAHHAAMPLDLKLLWNRPAVVELCGTQVLAPAREELLLLLAWHGYKHQWSVLEWLAAFSQCTRNCNNGPVKWEPLFDIASRQGSRRVLLLALLLSRELFDVPLPAPVVAQIDRDSQVRVLSQRITGRHFPECATTQNASGGWYHLRSRERLRDKARYIWRLAQTPQEIDWTRGRSLAGRK